MAELNYFDPPDPGANQFAYTGPGSLTDDPTVDPRLAKHKLRVVTTLQPDPGAFAPLPGVEDRRRQDFGDWEGGRYLDPTTFQEPVREGYIPPGSYLPRDVPPVDPRVANSAMSRSLGTREQIQQANLDDLYRMMQARIQARRGR